MIGENLPQDPEAILEPLRHLQWASIEQFAGPAEKFLKGLRDSGAIRKLFERACRDSDLLRMSEVNPSLTRIMLAYDEVADIQLRLHLFEADGEAEPHNHRWPFTALLLDGGYTHTLYEPFVDGTLGRIVSRRWEPPGAIYSLTDAAVHTTKVSSTTLSVVLRGARSQATWTRIAGTRVPETLGTGPPSAQRQRIVGSGDTAKMRDALAESRKLF